ncbi:MAG: hypothetical protein Q4D76_13930, partial [Oscillospiraceae bacterium]|nr:hypothetical protein [Oscillospiraceae bacterium]
MKIQGFEDVIKIKSFQIVSKINEHSLCNFCAVIDENKIGFYVNLAMNRTESEVKSEDNILLLKGLVNEINVIYSESETNIEVTIISSSILAEENIPEKIRVFQNTSKTAKDIIDYINNHGTYKFELKKADKLNNKIPHIVVQDNISDFEFVKNICADYNYGLIPDVSNNKIVIGESTGNLSVSIDEDYSEKIISIEGIYSRDNSSVKFRSMKKIDPGTVVCINSSGKNFSAFLNLKKYIITEVTVTEEYESVYFDYHAVERPDYSEYKADDRFVSVFNAEVTDNN